MIKTLAKSIREYKKYAILAPIFVVFEVIFEVLIPFVMSKMLDNGIAKSDNKLVLILGLTMILMAAVSLVCGILSGKYASIASAGFAKNLRYDMYAKIQTYSFANIDTFSTASLVTRMTTDITNVEFSFQMIIRIVVRAPFMLIFAFVMSMIVNWQIGLIFLVAIPVLGISLIMLMSRSFKPFSKMFKQYDIINRDVEENLIGIRAVKSFVKENDESEKFADASKGLKTFASKAEQILAWNMPIVQFAVYACLIAIAWFSAANIIKGYEDAGKTLFMTTGDLTSYFSYVMQILMSLMLISNIFVMITMSLTSARRIVEVLNVTPDIKNPEAPIFEVKNGDVDFEGVNFKYNQNAQIYNLTDCNVHIKSGQVVGIIGGTGSGKSSFVQLIPRLYDTSLGSVKVGGEDVRNYDLETLRNSVAYVLQKNVLFTGTIRDNLKWGNENASDEDLVRVTKQASAYDFVMDFPGGFDYDLGQGGVNVSGGQKQRLCIARALLKNPKILILDDSTSAVDTKTDANIRSSLRETAPDVTKIIISQRVSSVEDADLILVFDDGKIIAQGKHDDLVKNCQIYREIDELQKKGSDSEGGNN